MNERRNNSASGEESHREEIDDAKRYLEEAIEVQEIERVRRRDEAIKSLGPPRRKLGLASGKVVLDDYNPMWPSFFIAERENLESIFENVVRVEHIGSTSIRGMPAKPIVDIVVGFKTQRAVESAIPKMIKHGYSYVPGANRRSRSKFFGKGQPRLFHIHLVRVGAPGWRNLVCVRDYLRSNFLVREEYTRLKRRLVLELLEGQDSRELYAEGKSAFLNALSSRALRTAKLRRLRKYVRQNAENERAKRKAIAAERLLVKISSSDAP